MHCRINNELRDQIEAQTAEFLKKGGKVKKPPYSPDAYETNDTNVFKKHAKRLDAARKKALSTANWRKQGVTRDKPRANKNDQ